MRIYCGKKRLANDAGTDGTGRVLLRGFGSVKDRYRIRAVSVHLSLGGEGGEHNTAWRELRRGWRWPGQWGHEELQLEKKNSRGGPNEAKTKPREVGKSFYAG